VWRFFFASICVLLTWMILFFGGVIALSGAVDETAQRPVRDLGPDLRPGQADSPWQDRKDQAPLMPLLHKAAARKTASPECAPPSPASFSAFADAAQNRYYGHVPTDLD